MSQGTDRRGLTRRAFVGGAAGLGVGLVAGGPLRAMAAGGRSSSLIPDLEAYAHALVVGSSTQPPAAVACAYAVIDGRRSVARAVGHLSQQIAPGPIIPPATADSLFEIGSVTKVFAATLLAQTVGRTWHGRHITLDTPIGHHLRGVVNPEVEAVTLRGLAAYSNCITHTAPGQNSTNYTFAQLVDFLNAGAINPKTHRHVPPVQPRCVPGKSYYYSDLATGLLGYVLGQIRGKSWETLVKDQITGPLGMHDTVRYPHGQQLRRLVVGYDKSGPLPPSTDARFLGAGGQLKSTANDMLRFLAAQLDPAATKPVLRRAIPATHVNQYPRRKTMTGLGWFLGHTISGKQVISKNGATGGFGSYIAFVPAERRGAFVVTDFGHLTGAPGVNKLLGVVRGNGDGA